MARALLATSPGKAVIVIARMAGTATSVQKNRGAGSSCGFSSGGSTVVARDECQRTGCGGYGHDDFTSYWRYSQPSNRLTSSCVRLMCDVRCVIGCRTVEDT